MILWQFLLSAIFITITSIICTLFYDFHHFLTDLIKFWNFLCPKKLFKIAKFLDTKTFKKIFLTVSHRNVKKVHFLIENSIFLWFYPQFAHRNRISIHFVIVWIFRKYLLRLKKKKNILFPLSKVTRRQISNFFTMPVDKFPFSIPLLP